MTEKQPIIECVPNFSEGRDMQVIRQIADAIGQVAGVRLLNVDPGEDTHRTVITFAGPPEAVVEAAFQGVRVAGLLIDMRRHHGTHPRMGATDVLPLVPVSGITLQECAEQARRLARRIADELHIPCYCYEAAAFKPQHRNLAVCRAGEYEALAEKLAQPDKRPDILPQDCLTASGPVITETIARSGCIAVGARKFLIAVNFNLNTASRAIAHEIACDVREKGRALRQGNSPTGAVLRGPDGQLLMQPGRLKSAKAIGWYIEEYGFAQVSMNLTDLQVTALHTAFEEVSRCAQRYGVRVTGTEIIGLVPKSALTDAGRHFLAGQPAVLHASDDDLVDTAVRVMGLSQLRPYRPKERVIDYLLADF